MDKLGEEIISRYDKLKANRSEWENHWQEVAQYVIPRKDHIAGTTVNRGTRKNLRIYDATAIHANELLASGLHTMLTNPSTKWFGLATGDEEIDTNEDFNKWADKATDTIHNVLNNSNFQTEVHEVYLDLGSFGTTTLRIEKDDETVIRFFAEPITQVTVDENSNGMVDTSFREFEWTLRQVEQEWGIDVLSPERQRELTNDPNKKICIVHAILPRNEVDEKKGAKGMAWASLYIDKGEKKILEESGFKEFPTVVPRWTKISGEMYGRSPAMKSLPDTKMLNQMKKTIIRSAQKMVDPPMQAPDDGVSLPIQNHPNALNYYRAGTQDRIEPILTGGRVDFGFQLMQDQRNAIREAFFIDQLQLNDGPQMTATEVQQRTEEKLRVLSPILGRQHNEFLKPLIERILSIMIEKNMIDPAPTILEKKDIQVKYISMIAKAQKSVDAQVLTRVVESVAPLLQTNPDIMDNFDADSILRYNARNLGLPEKLFAKSSDMKETREQRAEMMKNQRMMEQQSHEADIAMKQGQGNAQV